MPGRTVQGRARHLRRPGAPASVGASHTGPTRAHAGGRGRGRPSAGGPGPVAAVSRRVPAAPDHLLWGWPVQGQSERGEDRAVEMRRAVGAGRTGGSARLRREPAKRVVRRRGKDVGTDGGGVNPPASPACSWAVGGEGLAPPSPWSVQRKRAGGELRDKPLSKRLFRARGRSPVSA